MGGDSKAGPSSRKLPLIDGDMLTEGIDGVSFELALDLRRFLRLKRLLKRLAVDADFDEPSESELEELDESEELELPKKSARTPGWDSSSILCCGVLSYMYAWDLS